MTVRSSTILNFDPENFDEADSKSMKKIYKLETKKGEKLKCTILKVADSKSEMTEKLSSKRQRLPRLNASDIYESMSSSDSSEDEDEVANIVKRRKEIKANVEKAKKITNRDIIAAHANARGKENRDDNHSINNPSLRPIQGNSENSFDSNHNKSVELNNLIPQNNSAKICEELEAKLKTAEEDVKYWQNKYEELRNSNSFHLTDKTGRQILCVLNDVSSRLKTGMGQL
ncbi:hypothetical protein PV327_011381 [Microctonus hyperodae]|uniref:Uncharacterized protein n=1 Tax=Microctonus hyperodae TaxID=165561 RepID=A0AA39C3C7_MICHY|nr:hypothetical protein PV327_011381 [Microctonus hyperodae]